MKKVLLTLFPLVTVLLMVQGYHQAIYVAPDDAMQGYVFRIIYYHVPSASVAFLFFAISLVGSIGYLAFRRKQRHIARRSPTHGRWPALKLASSSAPWC